MESTVPLNLNDLFSAEGLVAVVSGGGSGIGLAMAAALVQTGATRVYLLGRRLSVLQEAAQSLGDAAVAIECDVTKPASIAKAVSRIEKDVGYVDVLINNAGIAGPDHRPANKAATIDELQGILLDNWDGWASTFAINSSAVAGASASFLKLLDEGNKRRGWKTGKLSVDQSRVRDRESAAATNGIKLDDERSSQIITVASISGFNRFITAGLAYNGSKAASIHISKSLAHLLAPWGIRCNVINPGVFPSDMTSGSKEEYGYNEIPAGRKGTFQEMAGTILHLVGKGGAYVNGNVQITDGGRLSVMPATY